MAILRTIPVKKVINGIEVKTSESAIVAEKNYTTNGEYSLIIRGVDSCDITLDSTTTDRIKIKAMTKVLVIPDMGKIDEEWDEIDLDKGACIELVCVNRNWYILSSDGLKIW